jgi:hypothetical protein
VSSLPGSRPEELAHEQKDKFPQVSRVCTVFLLCSLQAIAPSCHGPTNVAFLLYSGGHSKSTPCHQLYFHLSSITKYVSRHLIPFKQGMNNDLKFVRERRGHVTAPSNPFIRQKGATF